MENVDKSEIEYQMTWSLGGCSPTAYKMANSQPNQ